MQVLFGSSEVFPMAKTGGLADVSAALRAALAESGVDIRIVMPGYPEALDTAASKKRARSLGPILGVDDVRLVAARTPDSNLPVWLVDAPDLFRRRGSLYVDENGAEWPDNAIRFAVLSHVAARLAIGEAGVQWRPDIVHVNDWHLGLVPALLAGVPDRAVKSLLTIHNLAFQGVFSGEAFPSLGLSEDMFGRDGVEFYGKVSFLKAAIRFADRITTVSPRYAREILTPEFGCGLEGLLATRADDLTGILNGIDYDAWSPENPRLVPFPYSSRDLSGKRRCKVALQKELGLDMELGAPVIAFVSRFTEQKMADVLPDVVPSIIARGAQLAVCGEGDKQLEQRLSELEQRYPGRVAVRVGYDEYLARRLLAGADLLAAPSRYEPCGLVQMYGMRFGTLPIVREVGGLADTVIGLDSRCGSPATGFMFEDATADSLARAIDQACVAFREPSRWQAMQAHGMERDFSWRRSAARYIALCEDLAGAPLCQPADEDARALDEANERTSLRPTGT